MNLYVYVYIYIYVYIHILYDYGKACSSILFPAKDMEMSYKSLVKPNPHFTKDLLCRATLPSRNSQCEWSASPGAELRLETAFQMEQPRDRHGYGWQVYGNYSYFPLLTNLR